MPFMFLTEFCATSLFFCCLLHIPQGKNCCCLSLKPQCKNCCCFPISFAQIALLVCKFSTFFCQQFARSLSPDFAKRSTCSVYTKGSTKVGFFS